jgi:triacylglycerol lipase
MLRRRDVLPLLAAAAAAPRRARSCEPVAVPMAHGPGWPGQLAPPYPDRIYFEHGDLYPFDPSATVCSTMNGWWLAEAAALAYHRFDEIQSKLPSQLRSVTSLGEGAAARNGDQRLHARGYIASKDSCALVVFCGTRVDEPENLGHDLLIDFDLRPPVPLGRGHVHRGFYDGLDHIWPDVERELATLAETGPRSFWFAGHSLGAAFATLAAARWLSSARRTVYTFGSPRVGDQAFVAGWDGAVPVHRFVHGRDLVARIPPTILPLGLNYADLGANPVYFDDNGLPVPATGFRAELLVLAAQLPTMAGGLALELAAQVFRGGSAAYASDWQRFVGLLSDNSVTAIYYVDYFKGQLGPA